MDCKQHPVVAKELDCTVSSEDHGREVLIEIRHFHRAEHQAEKLAVRTGDLAHEVNGPGPGGPVADRLPHEGRPGGVGFEDLVEFTVRHIDIWERPEAGEIERLALRI